MKPRTRKHFLPLFLLGLTGIATIPFSLLPLVQAQSAASGVPLPALVLLGMIQPALLLAVAVLLGNKLAPRIGLRSHLLSRVAGGPPFVKGMRKDLPVALAAGIALAVFMALADAVLFRPAMPAFFARAQDLQPAAIATMVMGVLYGGVTEELMMRWGAMSLFAWIGWKNLQRGSGALHPAVAWGAITLAALLFAVGHLPAALATGFSGPLLVLRVLLLNTIAGAVFGWLFWRRSLEAAMVAHASVHVAFYLLHLVGLQ